MRLRPSVWQGGCGGFETNEGGERRCSRKRSAERSKAFVENREDDGDDDDDDDNDDDDRNETVFAYMPHCEADLYEEILEHRWVNTGSED